MKTTRRLFLTGVFLITSPLSWAEGKAGTTAAPFLKIAVGARAAALGEAMTAAGDDATAVFWNPAGLARIKKAQFGATHTQWLQEATHDGLVYAQPVAGGVLGGGIVSFEVPDIPLRAGDTVDADGVFDARDTAYQIGWGQPLGDRWALGVTAMFVRQTLNGFSASGVAGNLGALYKTPWSPLTLGVALRHFGSELSFESEGDPLPTVTSAGAALQSASGRWLVAMDVRVPFEGDVSESVGLEHRRNLFKDGRGAFRAGYNTAAADAEDGTGLSLGLGLDVGRWGFDLTWAPYGVLGDTFRYGFRVAF